MAAPAAAQHTPPPDTEPRSRLCRVYAAENPDASMQDLRAHCRGRGFMLGQVTGFEAISNEALQATLVDAWRGRDRRVLLLSFRDDGTPQVEDLSGQIALAAGRGPMSELDGVELDIGAFTTSGEIGVRGRAEDTGSAKADRIDLAQQIALERARRASVNEPE